jgi:hypothetical protein
LGSNHLDLVAAIASCGNKDLAAERYCLRVFNKFPPGRQVAQAVPFRILILI